MKKSNNWNLFSESNTSLHSLLHIAAKPFLLYLDTGSRDTQLLLILWSCTLWWIESYEINRTIRKNISFLYYRSLYQSHYTDLSFLKCVHQSSDLLKKLNHKALTYFRFYYSTATIFHCPILTYNLFLAAWLWEVRARANWLRSIWIDKKRTVSTARLVSRGHYRNIWQGIRMLQYQ